MMREQPDTGEDTARARAVHEANIVTVWVSVIILLSFAIELVPWLGVIAWISVGAFVLWALWVIVLRDLYLDWQIDREINRPSVARPTVAQWLGSSSTRQLDDGRAPPNDEPPADRVSLTKP